MEETDPRARAGFGEMPSTVAEFGLSERRSQCAKGLTRAADRRTSLPAQSAGHVRRWPEARFLNVSFFTYPKVNFRPKACGVVS
jgi:hypothetical protein